MKKIILLLCLFMPVISIAGNPPTQEEIKKLELTWQVLNVADAAETLYFTSRKLAIEVNPILGKHPSAAEVIGFKVAAGFVHYYAIQKTYQYNPNYAKIFEYTTILIQGGAVGFNFKYVFKWTGG